MAHHGLQVEAKRQMYLTESMALTGTIAFALTFISPTLTYLALCGIGYQVMRSQQYWNTLVRQRPADLNQPSNASMLMLGALGMTGLILFYQFSLLPQMLITALAGGGLTGIFHHFVIRSQNALNRALEAAVKRADAKTTEYLLARGADPYFQDLDGNIAFHHAIQNKRNAVDVLHILKTASDRPNPTFLSIFEPPHDGQMSARRNDFVEAVMDRNRSLLASAKNLLREVYHYLANMTHAFVLYFRSKIAYPKDLHCKNNGGNTAGDFLEILGIDHDLQLEMAPLVEAQVAPRRLAPSAPMPAEETLDQRPPPFAPGFDLNGLELDPSAASMPADEAGLTAPGGPREEQQEKLKLSV